MAGNESFKDLAKYAKPVILLVEDDPAHATLIKRTFERVGITGNIDWVKDGEAAIEYLHHRQDSETDMFPKLIILDLRLPKLDGHEVLQKIKGSDLLKAIPVVILTTSTNKEDILKAYDNYANSYLVKPVDFGKLQDTIEEISTYWLGCNRSPQSPKLFKNVPVSP